MEPGFFTRVGLAFFAFFKILFNLQFAAQFQALKEGRALSAPVPTITPKPAEPAPARPIEAPKPAAPPKAAEPDPSPALQILAILQREGRLVDFLQEDISAFEDADVGAAARLVHDGCRKALSEYVELEPLRTEGEGARIVVDKGFDAAAIRLTGNVTGEPPFTGALKHHGWRARNVKLPKTAGQDARIVAPAEVEL